MNKSWRLILLTAILILFSSKAWHYSFAQTTHPGEFPETGHFITGDFLVQYQNTPDPFLVYGYPITDAFQDQTTNKIVQYFQKARFELHPELPAELRVKLTPLGKYLYTPGASVPIPPNFPACKQFPETGVQVCYQFLEFFNQHGGVSQFGYPISNFEFHNQRIVQYFQLARFEWYPELPPGQRVKLADLGREYFKTVGENPIRLEPDKDLTLQTTLSLHTNAFVRNTVTAAESRQTVYVIVQDQNYLPVADAPVQLTIVFPNGAEAMYDLPSTNANGITEYGFTFATPSLGMARVKVKANFNALEAQTVTSFRIWY